MIVIAKVEESIINLLKKGNALSFNELYDQLSSEKKFSEREVKEAVWQLLEKGKIVPNKQWKMCIKT